MLLPDRLARAQEALDKVLIQPASGREAAEAVLAEREDDEAAAIALRALGLALKENAQLGPATRALRRAIRVATRAGAPYRAAEARMSLVVILSDRGHTDAALAEGALAGQVLTGSDHARLHVNLGLVYIRSNRNADAFASFAAGIPVLRTAADTRWEAIALNLRGILYTYLGQNHDAEADLLRAEHLARQGGYQLLNALIQQNLGFLARRAGDLPEALARLDAAIPLLDGSGRPTAEVLGDKADALLAAGLAAEARATAARAIAEQEGYGFHAGLAESHLLHARAALADHDPAAAAASAQTARAMFGRQRRTTWADLARHVAVAARHQQGERTAALLRDCTRVADRLHAAGWPVTPLEARLLAGRIAADLGRADLARDHFAEVARHRARGPAETRTLAWHAQALAALGAGQLTAAQRAIRAGLRVHAENDAALGATDMRAHASVHGQELATLGLRIALDRNDARAVLRWAETWRAASLRRRPVRPPDDERLAADLAALRRATAQIAQTETTARAATQAITRSETSRLQAERLRLEQAVRDRSRYARGGAYAPETRFSTRALADALDGRTLVEFVRLEDQLHAVTVVGGHVRHHRLGSYADVLRALEMVRFAMNRMSRRFGSPAMQAAALGAYDHSRQTLDDLLFGSIRRTGAHTAPHNEHSQRRELVIVPTGSLHALPWTVLPTCADRPVSVTPSARLWLASAQSAQAEHADEGAQAHQTDHDPTPVRGTTVLMAGPGLSHAEPEIAALAARYPDATVLTGADATAETVAAALDGAAVAHVATHGRFRADHPLFSSLDMADGPLYVYDLERLGSTPGLLILSACESALSGVRPGDELMGLASAVFALGTRTLIASVTPVNDADTRTLMLALHARLSAGSRPAAALAEATAETGVAGFVCFGFGG